MPRTGVTAEKTFFGTDFVFPSGGSLPSNHAVLHLPSTHAPMSAIRASVSSTWYKFRFVSYAESQTQTVSTGTASLQCCWFVENLLLLFKYNHRPSEVFSISIIFFPALLAARVMKPLLILKYRQQIFIFGSPKEKFDQHAASI